MSRVAVIQLPLTLVSSPQEFMDWLRAPIERAVQARAQLIALPDFAGYALLGMFAPPQAEITALDLGALARAQGHDTVHAFLSERGPILLEFYQHVLQSLAERTGAWIVGGTAPEVETDHWYNTAFLFSPEGTTTGRQRQTHRSELEREWDMSVGTDLSVFETDAGRVGIVIGEDIRYPEVSRLLALRGANILAHPASDYAAADEQFLQDAWREVQSNQVFGLQAVLSGAGRRLRPAIYAPVEMTPDHRGILAQAGSEEEQVLTAELDFAALQRVVDEYPLFDLFNEELYRDLGKEQEQTGERKDK